MISIFLYVILILKININELSTQVEVSKEKITKFTNVSLSKQVPNRKPVQRKCCLSSDSSTPVSYGTMCLYSAGSFCIPSDCPNGTVECGERF